MRGNRGQIIKLTLTLRFQHESQVLVVTASPYDTIQTLKENILGDDSGVNPKYLILKFKDKLLLDDTKKLYEQGIVQSQTIFVDFISSKSGVQYSFNNLRKRPKFSFSKAQPQCRLIDKGLNLEAVCKNPTCKLFRKSVFINKGFGSFNIAKEVDECTCPGCKQETEAAHNFGYYKGRLLIKGIKEGQKKYELHEEGTDQKYYSFLQGSEKIQHWKYIEVSASELR